ncbi:MAG TPA: NADP-dependent isocitrate dehydrogenase [Candidatus Bilophila faecipullorum]|uniref:isocitrate dehydrogenase (NADP(+)) n=4 Tax=Bilophila TaxID=35832 RepID=A0A9D1R0K2_9BACT|nr:NADP-dependent isocitrate dehydrogenase [uncultured Bilophila sp.]HIW79248.1 NADP-dependent isocitrate dehydrogenase [Candidatus Bilophila faecipullorum]
MRKTVYWIEGDGIGPDVWKSARPVIDEAIRLSYGDERGFDWRELPAGEKALRESGKLLPEETLEALRGAELAIKGPLGTPVGTGFRSLNVTLRQTLDLYACIRPIRYFEGIESPVKHPERVNMIVFRENTEDVYAGIEYKAGTPEAAKLIAFLHEELGANVDASAAVGIKPMTEKGSRRLVRAAIRHALAQGLPSVTLVHKGNIMKFTEGAFRQHGYDVAREEFGDRTTTEADAAPGKLIIKDRIADAMFQEALIRPEQYSVLATPNLNGDYISDALAAQVGGLGLAPGVNMSEKLAFFEATHGTAPSLAGKDRANPGSLILSGALMLEHIGWNEAAERIYKAVNAAIARRAVTEDLAAQMAGAQTVGCTAFGEIIAGLL